MSKVMYDLSMEAKTKIYEWQLHKGFSSRSEAVEDLLRRTKLEDLKG